MTPPTHPPSSQPAAVGSAAPTPGAPTGPDAATTTAGGGPVSGPSETIRRLRAVRALLWALVGVMTVAWLFYGGGLESIQAMFRTAPAPVTTADIGEAAPPLRLPQVGGGEVDLASLRGKAVLLNFWATWCEPCKAEMPVFERAQQQYRDRGLVVLGVDFQERDEQITAFLSQVGVTFPSLVDRTGEVTRQWRATGLPTTFLIDRQGIIRDVRVGPYTDAMLEERLTKLLVP